MNSRAAYPDMEIEKVDIVIRYPGVISKVAKTESRNRYEAVVGRSDVHDTIIVDCPRETRVGHGGYPEIANVLVGIRRKQ